MKKIGFLSFGHWANHPSYKTRTASDTLLQSIDLAVACEEMGLDGAYFRVHHFAAQLGSPFPLLSAIGAKTKKIEIGTAVIDMRYENPLYMVEDAGAADIISRGRLQLGISRGSPEQVIDGWRYFGYEPADGETDAEMGRRKGLEFLEKVKGDRVVLHYGGKNRGLLKNISVADAEWIAGLLSQLSDNQIKDAFRAANYTPSQVNVLAQTVRYRSNELAGLRPNIRISRNR